MADNENDNGGAGESPAIESRLMLTLTLKATPDLLSALNGVIKGEEDIERDTIRNMIRDHLGVDLSALCGNVLNISRHDIDLNHYGGDADYARSAADTEILLELVRQVNKLHQEELAGNADANGQTPVKH